MGCGLARVGGIKAEKPIKSAAALPPVCDPSDQQGAAEHSQVDGTQQQPLIGRPAGVTSFHPISSHLLQTVTPPTRRRRTCGAEGGPGP